MTHPSWVAYTEWLDAYSSANDTKPMAEPLVHSLVYVSAPYSNFQNKQSFMIVLTRFIGRYMMAHPDKHLVTPLFNHYTQDNTPGMGRDYSFWMNYSRNLLKRCDRMIVLTVPGWDKSVGVSDEIEYAKQRNIPIEYVSVEDLRERTGLNQEAEQHVYESIPVAQPAN